MVTGHVRQQRRAPPEGGEERRARAAAREEPAQPEEPGSAERAEGQRLQAQDEQQSGQQRRGTGDGPARALSGPARRRPGEERHGHEERDGNEPGFLGQVGRAHARSAQGGEADAAKDVPAAEGGAERDEGRHQADRHGDVGKDRGAEDDQERERRAEPGGEKRAVETVHRASEHEGQHGQGLMKEDERGRDRLDVVPEAETEQRAPSDHEEAGLVGGGIGPEPPRLRQFPGRGRIEDVVAGDEAGEEHEVE